MVDRSSILPSMNQLPLSQRVAVVSALVEGNSIRATVRMTGVAKNTVTKLVADLGPVCAQYMDRALRHLPCRRIQCDEIWSYCYAKQRNVTPQIAERQRAGDVWTWIALDADTKLVCAWLVGDRSASCANEFVCDLAGRLSHRVQLTTDGYRVYLDAVEDAFGSEIDYAMLVKVYGSPTTHEARRYSPAHIIATQAATITGTPNCRRP
jgi:IS1 family transposase